MLSEHYKNMHVRSQHKTLHAHARCMTGFTTSKLRITCHRSVAELLVQSLTMISLEQRPPTAVQGATQGLRQWLLDQVVGNGTPGHHIWHQAQVGQLGAGDWGGVVLLQPFLHGGPLIGAPISGYHWISHPALRHVRSIVGQLASELLVEYVTITGSSTFIAHMGGCQQT